jgi:twitching motility protein PilT
MTVNELLTAMVAQNASDLHLIAGLAPYMRINGFLASIKSEPLTPAQVSEMIIAILKPAHLKIFQEQLELDFSYQVPNVGRFRVNIYTQRETPAASFRFIPEQIRSIDELKLPQVFHEVTKMKQGLVLITGPTGEGKSTSLAALIEEINQTRSEHIVTIEDPIEFLYQPKLSIISQREVHTDTLGWTQALKSVLREDPDVVLIGEMRDLETISSTLTIAETGHLVFATLHTNSSSQTIDRIIDVFPDEQQSQVRQQLASTLAAVFSQRLVPSRTQGRVAAVEIMIASSAIKNLIRENKSFQIDSVMQTSSEQGMMTMETSLANWVKSGAVSIDVAKDYALRPLELDRLLGQ